MSERKTPEELAAEITIAALSTAQGAKINYQEAVCKFYRAVYKEICYCTSKPAEELELN